MFFMFFFLLSMFIWCPSSPQTQTSLYLFWQSDRICATLVLRYQCEHIVQALSGSMLTWKREFWNRKNWIKSKTNLWDKTTGSSVHPQRPSFLRVCDNTICRLLWIFPSTDNCHCISSILLSLHSGVYQRFYSQFPESEKALNCKLDKALNWGWFLVCMNYKSMMTDDTAQGMKR